MNNWIIQDSVQTGRSHIARQFPCQDALASVNAQNLVLSIAADGVGSLSNSHIAAKAAVEGAIDWFRRNLKSLSDPTSAGNAIRQRLIPALKKHITARSNEHGVLLNTLDCNFAFACILPESNFALWGVLGDGAVCVFRTDHNHVLNAADSILANGTATIMQDDAASCLQLQSCQLSDQKLLGFMVMTDGLENELYRKNSVLVRHSAEPYFNAMLLPTERERAAAISRLLTSLPDTFEDDISLSVISNARRSVPVVLDPDPSWLCTCGNRNSLDAAVCSSCRMDFQQLYGGLDFGDDPESYFLRLNCDPARERAMLNQPNFTEEQTNIPKAPPVRTPREEGVRLSAGQLHNKPRAPQNTRAPAGKVNVSNTVRGANAPVRNSTPRPAPSPTQSTGSHTTSTPPIFGTPDPEPAVFVGTDKVQLSFMKSGDMISRIISILALVIATLALILSILANLNNSRPQKPGESSSHASEVGSSSRSIYVVNAPVVYVYECDGEELGDRLARLESETIVQRLDEQEIPIGEVVYIHVRTDAGIEGWSNLAALALLETDNAS